ncbi:MAG: tyrosine-type recombinase/integrase [Gammaproteobacteria bacterium]|nr:tyrosine-type recombinase/integrase [Gammaproteobacteria bacterium]
MSSRKSNIVFQSALGALMEQFLRQKRAVGYRYEAGAYELKCFDRFLAREAPQDETLRRDTTRKWLARRPHESGARHQVRVSVVRQFAKFLLGLDHAAYVPEHSLAAKRIRRFSPHVFTHAEMQRLLLAADGFAPSALSPLRHLVIPEVFRLLYGCGFRIGEVLGLRAADVDLNRGVLTVRDGKFGKDRLVPPALPLVNRLRAFDAMIGKRPGRAFFFPSHHGGPWRPSSFQGLFRQMLFRSDIPFGGRGKGPRLHDLRHTFAVHTLLRWYREGADLDGKLAVLATYMGHSSVDGTQLYLHLTAELFPQITARTGAAFGDVIPRRAES